MVPRYLRTLASSWWLVLLVVVAAGASGFLATRGELAHYKSTIRLIVAATANNLSDVDAHAIESQHAQTLAQLASSQPALTDAVVAAGKDGAAASVTATAAADGQFVTITVISTRAAAANAVANAFANTIDLSAARLAGAPTTPLKVTSLGPAIYPSKASTSHRTTGLAIGAAIGLVVALLLVAGRQLLNPAIVDSDELAAVTGLQSLGAIPRNLPNHPLPAATDPRSARAEGYRQIRTTLQATTTLRPLTLAITSATLGEGKTSVATNLAVVLSKAGHRVALIDADLRRPQVATYFGLREGAGLAHVLLGSAKLAEAVQVFDDGRLALLTAGKTVENPSELLGTERLDAILDALAARYEFVLIDTPPVLPVTDALVIAPIVDAVVLVVGLGKATPARVRHAIEAIKRVDADLLGVVPNMAGRGADRDYSYPYNYEHGRKVSRSARHETPYNQIAPHATGGKHSPPQHAADTRH